jgi:hypothetical protein
MTKRIGIAAVFLVGCAVGGGASQLVVPKASAQQAATLTKWEYACTQPGSLDELLSDAKAHGSQSWEMVGLTNSTVCFKRPKM